MLKSLVVSAVENSESLEEEVVERDSLRQGLTKVFRAVKLQRMLEKVMILEPKAQTDQLAETESHISLREDTTTMRKIERAESKDLTEVEVVSEEAMTVAAEEVTTEVQEEAMKDLQEADTRALLEVDTRVLQEAAMIDLQEADTRVRLEEDSRDLPEAAMRARLEEDSKSVEAVAEEDTKAAVEAMKAAEKVMKAAEEAKKVHQEVD